MPDTHYRINDVTMAGGGYGFAILNQEGAPLVHFTFTTKMEAATASLLIEEVLATVIDVRLSLPEPEGSADASA